MSNEGARAGVLAACAVVAVAAMVTVGVRSVSATSADAGLPSLPASVSAVPLGVPAAAPPGEGGYAVLATQPGTGEPVGWDPCRPVRYVVGGTPPPDGGYLLQAALAEVSRATGLLFVDEGPTDETATEGRRPMDADRYGDRWSPVLVLWSDPTLSPRLAGDVAGFAGPSTYPGDEPGTARHVSGQLVLDAPQLAETAAGPAGLARARAVVLHELAHLVGLDHVEDPAQLMNPSTTPLQTGYAEGDLRGLAAVSGRPCRTDR